MPQPIAGVSSSATRETTVMVVWPTAAAGKFGQQMGRLCAVRTGYGTIFNLGNLFALLLIAPAVGLFFFHLLPGVARRYCLTNRRVIIQRRIPSWRSGWKEEAALSLDDFDAIDTEILPGQAWYPAGDLVLKQAGQEKLRLAGVSRPETFRQTVLKARQSHVGVQQAQRREAAQRAGV